MIHVEHPKDSTQKLLELTNSVKLQGTKSIYKNQLHLNTLAMNYYKS